MATINCWVSDTGSLNQHWLLSHVEQDFLFACMNHYSASPGVCRDSHSSSEHPLYPYSPVGRTWLLTSLSNPKPERKLSSTCAHMDVPWKMCQIHNHSWDLQKHLVGRVMTLKPDFSQCWFVEYCVVSQWLAIGFRCWHRWWGNDLAQPPSQSPLWILWIPKFKGIITKGVDEDQILPLNLHPHICQIRVFLDTPPQPGLQVEKRQEKEKGKEGIFLKGGGRRWYQGWTKPRRTCLPRSWLCSLVSSNCTLMVSCFWSP